MVSVLDFAMRIPELCGSPDPERWAVQIRAAYEDERSKGRASAFYRGDLDRKVLGWRLRTVFGFTAFEHDKGPAEHCYNLLKIWEAAHYRIEHGETQYADEEERLIAVAAVDEARYPDIADVLTVQQASENGGW